MPSFHISLADDECAALEDAAAEAGCPAADLALRYVRRGLDARARDQRQAALRCYVDAVAGTSHDLDQELEASSVDHLVDNPQRRRWPR